MATHCSILAWETPWTEELVGLQSPAGNSTTQLRDWPATVEEVESSKEIEEWLKKTIVRGHLTPTKRAVRLTCVPQNSYVGALTPSVTIFGDKAFCCSVAK